MPENPVIWDIYQWVIMVCTMSDDLSARIRAIIGGQSVRSFALGAGVAPSTLQSILSGNRPTLDTLIAIARAGRVSIDWLATGQDMPLSSSVITMPVVLDEDLLGRVVEGIRRVYKEVGAVISDRDVGRLAARIYADLSDAYDDPDERAIGLKMALQHLRRDLQGVPLPADMVSGKRLA